jgi:hypothetical protein
MMVERVATAGGCAATCRAWSESQRTGIATRGLETPDATANRQRLHFEHGSIDISFRGP